MGFFSSSNEEKTLQSPIAEITDSKPVLALDGRGGNLFIYDKFVVFDRTKGGIMNIGNRTYKIIPIKNIMAVQVKSVVVN